MGKGWNDVKRGPLLNEMYTNYQEFQNRPISERYQGVGLGAAQSPRVIVSLTPFSFDVANPIRVRTNQRNQLKMGSAVGARVDTTPASTDVAMTGFKPATIIMREKLSAGVRKESRITGKPYKFYETDTFRHPFGLAAAELEYEAFNSISTALVASNRTFSYTAEKVAGR